MKWGDRLKEEGVLKTPEIVEAFNKVKREDFIPPVYETQAGQDRPIPIGYEQTNSAPTVVGQTIQWLQPEPGNKVLDIGSGSGWTSAIIGEIVGEKGSVIGVERIEGLVAFSTDNIAKYKLKNVRIKQAGDELGDPDDAPYDRILVSAATDEKHVEKLLNQLKEGGIAVVPVSDLEGRYQAGQTIVVYEKKEGQIKKEEHPGYIFVPLITDQTG